MGRSLTGRVTDQIHNIEEGHRVEVVETKEQVGGCLEGSSEMAAALACTGLILLSDEVPELAFGKMGSEVEMVAFAVSTVVPDTVAVVEVAEIEAAVETVAEAALAVVLEGSKKILEVRMAQKEVGIEIIEEGIEAAGSAVLVVVVAEHSELGEVEVAGELVQVRLLYMKVEVAVVAADFWNLVVLKLH